MLGIKLKSPSEKRIIVSGVACGAASLSSQYLRYVQVPDILVDQGREAWIEDIPCYDAANNLVKGNAFTGKIFLRYRFEGEGAGSNRIAAGDVFVSGGGEDGSRCIDLLERGGRENSAALSMIASASPPERLVPEFGNFLGEVRVANALGRAYLAAHRKDLSDYVILIGNLDLVSSITGTSKSLECVTGPHGIADLMERDGKAFCRMEATGILGGTAYERRLGDNTTLVVLSLNQGEPFERNAVEFAFRVALGSPDAEWVNETGGTDDPGC
ncbi:hypothetical protein COY95_01035 [Candidatus Woesearchaeota archaeon CG_4_10_14_0_8_um_filter_47_5]|nr:MAG: hypothetical protein COY95_01035 [Candidatus Woesearchaeota archaeon CG_4_10_14_0_8_um_filter_47_5]